MKNKYKLTGLIGIWLSIGLFFLALSLKNRIEGPLVLVYPFSLLSGYFFIGLATGGTLKSGFKQALVFLFMLGYAILYGLLLRRFKTK